MLRSLRDTCIARLTRAPVPWEGYAEDPSASAGHGNKRRRCSRFATRPRRRLRARALTRAPGRWSEEEELKSDGFRITVEEYLHATISLVEELVRLRFRSHSLSAVSPRPLPLTTSPVPPGAQRRDAR